MTGWPAPARSSTRSSGPGSTARRGEPAAAAIEAINRCGAPVVACDIASGVDASSGEVEGVAVEADLTVSFHAAKLGQRIAPGKWHTGELRVVPIGIPAGAPGEPVAGTIDPAVLALAPRRGARSTKFSSGQVAIAGGSRGLTGAVRMSSLAAIRAGAGYATVAVPADLEPVFEAGEPEVMSVGCPGGDGCLAPASAEGGAAAPSSGPPPACSAPASAAIPARVELAREVVGAIEAPLVIDADGLNAFAGLLGPLAAREAPTVLTPHAGELGRLLGRDSEEIAAHRLAAAREAARAARAVVVLKGDDTIVTDGERVAVNAISAPGLATAGSGDVLSGHRRGAARPRPGAVRGRLRGGRRPCPCRPRRGGPGRLRRVGDRHRRDRLDRRWPAARAAGRIISPRWCRCRYRGRRVVRWSGRSPGSTSTRSGSTAPGSSRSWATAPSSARWSRPTATATAPTAAPTPRWPAARPGWPWRPRSRPNRSAAASSTSPC